MKKIGQLKVPERLFELNEKLLGLRLEGKIHLQNGDTGYASAPSNIALLKYWGKKEAPSQCPLNTSLSYTLGGFRSFTKVEAKSSFLDVSFVKSPSDIKKISLSHSLSLNGKDHLDLEKKMSLWLSALISPWACDIAIRMTSSNNFPTACGIASSASGYAAMVGAISDMLQLSKHFSQSDMSYWISQWARLGSGSSCRSTFSNSLFVEWDYDEILGENSIQGVVHHKNFESLRHCVIIVDDKEKTVTSSKGHKLASSSLLNNLRVSQIPFKKDDLRRALHSGDFEKVSDIAQEDALLMHAVMLTSRPKIKYFDTKTVEVISEFLKFKYLHKLFSLWTLDAGPNVHLLYLKESEDKVMEFLKKVKNNKTVSKILINNSSLGFRTGQDSYFELVSKGDLIVELN